MIGANLAIGRSVLARKVVFCVVPFLRTTVLAIFEANLRFSFFV